MSRIFVSLSFLSLFLSEPYQAFAQFDPQKSFEETYAYGCPEYGERQSCGVVIAMSGLKLRGKPGFNSKTLAVIPFGETVQRTEKGYDLRPDDYSKAVMTPDSISGYWQEITWRGKTGFAFSTFIGTAIYRMDEDAYLLFEGAACWNDCYASPSYHYYGVFTNSDSSRWETKKVKPVFCTHDFEFLSTSIHAESKKRPAFILASKKPLAEGPLMSGKKTETIFEATHLKETSQRVGVPASQFVLSMSDTCQEEGSKQSRVILEEKSTGRKQILQPTSFGEKIELVWSVDLDHDGIMDFMLAYTGGHSYGCQLFLSSFATEKQLVKPMKIYWFGDCC